MLILLLETFLIAIGCGVVAAVYRSVLAYEPILNWWFRFGNRYEGRWFFAPVWGCVKCISGQLALWFYFFIHKLPACTHECTANQALYIFGILFAICGAILTAIVLDPLIKKL